MHIFSALMVYVATSAALCPMSELVRRGLVPEHVKAKYLRGEGLGEPKQRRQENSNLYGRAVEELVQLRFEERDEDVDIDATILTPKAHRRHFEKRGLVGGILAPLTGILAALDVPTPQESGLKSIPGDDPDHQYIPPGLTDQRGVCPTLNTMANHGYISRTGITTFAEATNAAQIAYSLSYDTAIFVSAFGLLAGGDIPTGKFSIGGRDSRVPETLGQPLYGIDRHGFFEIDASPSRGDRYFGDNHSFNITQWNILVTDANNYGNGLFNLEFGVNNAANAIEASRATNPEFTLGANFLALYATRALLIRSLANGTAPNTPDFQNIAPFYLNETFPYKWYRAPDPYSLGELFADIGYLYLSRPQPLGANYNGSFVPMNLTIPDAPAQVSCLGASLLAAGTPNEAEEVIQAANAVKDQILAAVLGSAACNISDYETDGGDPYYIVEGENTDAGSGSGITHFGEWDDQTVKPEGASAGQPT